MSQEIIDALKELDPKNDDHWTGDGLPKLSALKDVKANRQEVTAAAPHFTRENPKVEIEQEIETLIGSDKQPAQFTLQDGTTLGLDYVVAKAQQDSGLNPVEWNSLDDEEREEYIAFTVANLDNLPSVVVEETEDNSDDLVSHKNALEEKIEKANAAIVEATKARDAIQAELDIVIKKLQATHNDKTTQKDIMAFIKSQNEQRAARVNRNRQIFEAVGNLKSPLDSAMASSRGAKRPIRQT